MHVFVNSVTYTYNQTSFSLVSQIYCTIPMGKPVIVCINAMPEIIVGHQTISNHF